MAGKYTSPNAAANKTASAGSREAITNPNATSSVPKYSGLRVNAYGPRTAKLWFFARCPAAQPRSSRPATDIGVPHSIDDAVGEDQYANAATRTNPIGTRSRCTKSAYGLVNHGMAPQLAFQCCEDLVNRHVAHAAIDGVQSLVGRHGMGTAQHLQRPSVWAITLGIGRAKDRDSRLLESRSQMQWTAIHTNDGHRSPRRIDQTR